MAGAVPLLEKAPGSSGATAADTDRTQRAFYDKWTRLYYDETTGETTFRFKYPDGGGLNWQDLKILKDAQKWGLIAHPMILHFVNERLLDSALFYAFHIFAYGVFLLLLSWHVFNRDFVTDLIVTAFLLVFFFFMFVKAGIKLMVSKSISFWFVVAYIFNLVTYLATAAYVWLPTIFDYDDYHENVKNIVLWFLPVVAIISAYINFLYILRKSPYGVYIFMMTRILRSFTHIATIWIPTLIAFSFAFHLIMRDSGIEPWQAVEDGGGSSPVAHNQTTSSSTIHKLFVVLQAITKTSTMMIGEVDANDILGTKQWIPAILVLVFEIITVILLMNLMVSLAVGDVADLRHSAEAKLLQIKVNYVVEALQLSEQMTVFGLGSLHTKRTPDVLWIGPNGEHLAQFSKGGEEETAIDWGLQRTAPSRLSVLNKTVDVQLDASSPLVARLTRLEGAPVQVKLGGFRLSLRETPYSGIGLYDGETGVAPPFSAQQDGWVRRAAKWLIGLNWASYIHR